MLVFAVPVFLLAFTGLCCGKGIWTFGCWMRYLAVFSGVRLVLWVVGKCVQ